MKRILVFLLALFLFTSCAGNTPSELTRVDSPEAQFSDMGTQHIPSTPPIETARISFLAAGDNVIHPCIYMDAEERATEETRPYNFKPMYEDVADYIAGFDLAFINQETLMCGEGFALSGYPNFNSPQDLGRDLLDIGFDIVGISNNHMLDKGSKGLLATINFWESEEMSDILMIGGYKSREDFEQVLVSFYKITHKPEISS